MTKQTKDLELKATPLVDHHVAAGARMVPFSGWNMPVQYEGILAEHHHTREAVSLFDCSHMGQFRLRGPQIAAELDAMLPRLASSQKVGTCRYNFLLTTSGTVIDDIIVYRVAEDEFYLVVNAGTIDGDAAHIRQYLSAASTFSDESAATAKLDLQGPAVMQAMAALGFDLEALPRYFRFVQTELQGIPLLLSRTGYTGEAGFEFYFPADQAAVIWTLLLDLPQVQPAGLGARDTLRLEMGYPLYGHELDTETTPVEAGFGPMLDLDHDYPGHEVLTGEPTKSLIGIRFDGRRAAREGAELLDPDGQRIGTVSSGSFGPSVGDAIALAYVAPGQLSTGDSVQAAVGRSTIDGTVVSLPFYQQGTARNPH